METINNLTTAASKAIWGEQQDPNNTNSTTTSQTTGTDNTMNSTTGNTFGSGGSDSTYTGTSGREPISGQLGNTAAGEPYDRGNVESSSTTTPYTATTHDPRVHTGTSSNAGPHSSNLANKADPRVDSDRDGSNLSGSSYDRSNTMGTPLGAGSAAVGGSSGLGSSTHGSSNLGSSNLGSSNLGSSTHGSSNLGSSNLGSSNLNSSTNTGPHSSNLANKADPRVDSDRSRLTGNTGSGNTGFYSSTSTNPLTSGSNTTSSTHNTDSGIGGIDSSRSTGHSSIPLSTGTSSLSHHGSNTTTGQSTYGSSTGNTALSHDGSQSINPGPTGSHVGKSTTDASAAGTTATGLKDAVRSNDPNSRPFSEFGGNKTSDNTGISFSEPGDTPTRGLHPIDGQGAMSGAHSHRGSGAFQTTQDTHDTLHKRDHADGADHTIDRKGSTGGITGKGTPGGMPDIVARDLEKIKTGKGVAPGGSDADLGLDAAHGGPKTGATTGTHGHAQDEHSDEKLSTMDKIKAKLHHSK